MRIKRIILLLTVVAMLFAFTACDSKKDDKVDDTSGATKKEQETDNKTDGKKPDENKETASDSAKVEIVEMDITDMIGRKVMISPASYKKVVCIGAGALRMYSYVGDINLLSGVEDIDNTGLEDRPKMFDSVARPYVIAFEEHFSKLPSAGVGGPNAQAAEAEKILSCNPDIVISEYEDVEKADALQEQLGVPVVTLKSGPGGVFDESFQASLTLLGTIFGKENRASELNAFITKEAQDIEKRTEKIADENKPTVYVCGLGNWGTTNHLMTSATFKPFEIAHVKNAVSGLLSPGVNPIEAEKLVSLGDQIDIIIMDAAAVKNIKPIYAENKELFDGLKAWNDNLYLEMPFNAYYTNYELMLANTWFIGKTVYPEAFEDIDMKAKTDEITKVFLGQELSTPIFSYPSSFGGYQKINTAEFFK